MIKEIQCIYILNDQGNPIFIRENFIQGTENADHAMLSNFFNALQSFAMELGENETRSIDLETSKIFSIKDSVTNYSFILKCDRNAKPKKMFKILQQIYNIFIDMFTGHIHDFEEAKSKIMPSFESALDEIIEPVKKFESLFK